MKEEILLSGKERRESKECRTIARREYRKKYYLENKSKHLNFAKEHYLKHKKDYKGYALKRLYGLSLLAFENLLNGQNNSCAICRNRMVKKFSVDHDHITGKVRGILCSDCNSALGFIKDDINIAQAIISYLINTK